MAARVALVTGSGKRRVGNVVADTLAERGYALVVHYHRSGDAADAAVARLRGRGTEVIAVQADVTQENDVRRLVRAALERFGRIDVLVNAAAIWNARRLEDVTADDVRAHFEINTLGTFLCTQQAGLVMVGQPEGGSIITIGEWATERPYPNYPAYFVSKGAIPTLTRTMAVELGMRNPHVRVNAILPGPVMFPEGLAASEQDAIARTTLVQSAGRPEVIGRAVLFFAENEFVTGVCLPVDGGRTIYAGEH
jgi:pteridine reductase